MPLVKLARFAVASSLWLHASTYPQVLLFNLEDCILQGLKGVSSDAAAKMVKQACEQKALAYRESVKSKQDAEDGKIVLLNGYDVVVGSITTEEGKVRVVVKNERETPEPVTFIGLDVSKPKGEDCWGSTEKRRFGYRVVLERGKSIEVLFPDSSGSKSFCIDIALVRVKEAIGYAERLSRGGLLGALSPLASDPYSEQASPFKRQSAGPVPTALAGIQGKNARISANAVCDASARAMTYIGSQFSQAAFDACMRLHGP